MKAVLALLPILLAACSGSDPQPAQPTWPGPIDRADRATWYDRPIDASGIDPAWRVEVRQADITVTPPSGDPVLFPRQTAKITADSGVYAATVTDGSRLVLRLQNNWCNLRPSDPLLPFTVTAEFTPPAGEAVQTLHGCGAQVGYRTRPAAAS